MYVQRKDLGMMEMKGGWLADLVMYSLLVGYAKV
jgi:hypothetical protein